MGGDRNSPKHFSALLQGAASGAWGSSRGCCGAAGGLTSRLGGFALRCFTGCWLKRLRPQLRLLLKISGAALREIAGFQAAPGALGRRSHFSAATATCIFTKSVSQKKGLYRLQSTHGRGFTLVGIHQLHLASSCICMASAHRCVSAAVAAAALSRTMRVWAFSAGWRRQCCCASRQAASHE